MESFKYIFLYLVRDGQQQDLNVAATFIKVSIIHIRAYLPALIIMSLLQSVGGFEMADLMHSDTKNVLNLLLLYLSTHRDRILTGVRMLAEMSACKMTPGENVCDFIVSQHLGVLTCIVNIVTLQANFLEPHLHGIVAFFNFMLVRLDFFESCAKGKLVCLIISWCQCMYNIMLSGRTL